MPIRQDPLAPYRGKRDFERTPEPPGGRKRRTRAQPRFVIHKHDATTPHYDFRLEAAVS
jgi:bifunctional non-homologous end joining protein LigD